MEQVERSVASPERREPRGIPPALLIKGVAAAVVIVLAVSLSLAFIQGRRYTPSEQAMWEMFISLQRDIAEAGGFLERFLPSAGNESAGEVNHVSWLAANHCLDEARYLSEALQRLDRKHRAEWLSMSHLFIEMEQDWLENFHPHFLDEATAESLVDLGKRLAQIGYELTDEKTGALRHKIRLDSSGSGITTGVIVDGERLRATATGLRELMDTLPGPAEL